MKVCSHDCLIFGAVTVCVSKSVVMVVHPPTLSLSVYQSLLSRLFILRSCHCLCIKIRCHGCPSTYAVTVCLSKSVVMVVYSSELSLSVYQNPLLWLSIHLRCHCPSKFVVMVVHPPTLSLSIKVRCHGCPSALAVTVYQSLLSWLSVRLSCHCISKCVVMVVRPP